MPHTDKAEADPEASSQCIRRGPAGYGGERRPWSHLVWTLLMTILTCQAKGVVSSNRDMTILRVINHFLVGFEAYSTQTRMFKVLKRKTKAKR